VDGFKALEFKTAVTSYYYTLYICQLAAALVMIPLPSSLYLLVTLGANLFQNSVY